jgi:hypothetical protein
VILRQGQDGNEPFDALGDRAIGVLERKGRRSAGEYRPFLRSGFYGREGSLFIRHWCRMTASWSAICGTHFGETKAVVSMRRKALPPQGGG